LNKFLSVLAKILIIVGILLLAIVVLVISVNSEKVPEIYAYTTDLEAKALTGNYKWYAFSEVLEETNYTKDTYIFKNENTLLVAPNEKITLANSSSLATRHNFTQLSFEYEDSNGNRTIVPNEQQSNSYGDKNYLDFTVPEKEDTYFYYFKLDYHEKGYVEYALKIIVSTEPVYDIEELQKYKNTSLYDIKSINELLSLLSYSKNITNLITIQTENDYKLIVKYSNISVDRSAFLKNSIALFALIPEVNVIEYSSPEDTYVYTREEVEIVQGRDVTDYAFDKELWENEVLYSVRILDQDNTKYKIFVEIAKRLIESKSGETLDMISFDTSTFDEHTVIGFSDLNKYKFLNEMQKYSKVVSDISFSRYLSLNYSHMFLCAEQKQEEVVPSGDGVVEEEISNSESVVVSGDSRVSSGDDGTYLGEEIRIFVRKNNKNYHYIFYVNYIDGEWVVNENVKMVL